MAAPSRSCNQAPPASPSRCAARLVRRRACRRTPPRFAPCRPAEIPATAELPGEQHGLAIGIVGKNDGRVAVVVRDGLDVAYTYGLAVHLHGSKRLDQTSGSALCCSSQTALALPASPAGTWRMSLPCKQRHSPKRL